MKKDYIETTQLEDYIDAMKRRNGIMSEFNDKSCTIKQIHLGDGGLELGQVMARIDVQDNVGTVTTDLYPHHIKLYRREFEDGDYVRQQDGSIVICAGIKNGRYLFHAALTPESTLDTPDEFYTYGSVMPGDRLCTEEEMMRINGELMKAGKFFDPVKKKLVDSVFKQHTELCKTLLREYNLYHSKFTNEDGVSTPSSSDLTPCLYGFWCSGPIKSNRGKLKSKEAIQDCINAYESRIQELTDMCNEIYEKLKQSQNI